MFGRLLLFLMLLMMGLLFAADAQTLDDTLTVKPGTEVTLNFDYDLPDTAAFNDVIAFKGVITWPQTNGFAMVFIPGTLEESPIFENFLTITNESEEFLSQHKAEIAGAGAFDIRIDQDTTLASATFIAPDTFELIEVIVMSTFTLNESPTEFSHVYHIFVDPTIGLPVDTPETYDALSAELYPNPTDGTLVNLNIDTDFPGYTTTKVYDILGREVKEITSDTYFATGPSHYEFNMNGLEAGTYFVRVSTSNITITKSFTLIR